MTADVKQEDTIVQQHPLVQITVQSSTCVICCDTQLHEAQDEDVYEEQALTGVCLFKSDSRTSIPLV